MISFAVLGRLTDFTLDLDATFLGAFLTAVLTAVAFGLRVLVLRTLGDADAVIKNESEISGWKQMADVWLCVGFSDPVLLIDQGFLI